MKAASYIMIYWYIFIFGHSFIRRVWYNAKASKKLKKNKNTLPFSNVIRVKAEGKEGAMITELYTVYRTELLKYCCMICGNLYDMRKCQ